MTTYQSKQHETPASKSQIRLLAALSIGEARTYEAAATLLDAANMRRDAVPMGKTWRDAAKLSNTELIAACAVITDTEDDRPDYGL